MAETITTLTINSSTVCSAGTFTKTGEISDQTVTENATPITVTPPYTSSFAKGTCVLSASLTYVDPTTNLVRSFTSLPSNPDFEWLNAFDFDDAGTGADANRAGVFTLSVSALSQYTPQTDLDATLTIKNTQ